MQTAATQRNRFLGKADRILGGTATAVAAVAGVGLVGEAQQAQASVVSSGPVNIVVPATTSGIYLNVVTNVANASPALAPGWDINPWGGTTLNFFTPTPNPGGGEMVGSGTTVTNIGIGTLVSGASTFTTAGSTFTTGNFTLNSNQNFYGFRFIDETDGNQIKFGFAQMSIGATLATRSVIGYAYDNVAGTGITSFDINAVPEPSSLALLSVGAVGLAAWRRRRSKKVVTETETQPA